MDNNNNLPYGAISWTNNSLLSRDRTSRVPRGNATQQIPRFFSATDVARNANLNQLVSRPWAWGSNGSERLGQSPTRPLGIRAGQPVTSNTTHGHQLHTLNRSSNVLINDDINNQMFPDRTGINSRTGEHGQNILPGYFRYPWNRNGIYNQGNVPTSGNNVLSQQTGVALAPTTSTTSRELNSALRPGLSTVALTSAMQTTTRFHSEARPPTGIKRKVSRDDADDDLPRPSSKQLLTEEKMAAKMNNLRISTDHCYSSNGLLMNWNEAANHGAIINTTGCHANRKSEKEQESDNEEMESEGLSIFTFAPGVKEALARTDTLLPQAIIDHINKPCLAVIPWKPPDDLLKKDNFYSFENKTDDEKAKDYEISNKVTVLHLPELGSGIEHVEVIEETSDTFDFDGDDMDL